MAEWTAARLRETLAKLLRHEVGGMSLDNFLVRAHRRYVEKFGDVMRNLTYDQPYAASIPEALESYRAYYEAHPPVA